ncbi:hypothetical protein EJB05_40659 [Eragrostis curvula]|uniref:Uncharacterized protein n=1 Tax=Eragrostis curvula TaxID=38414 RepID=A0A5J9TQC5_9POAL|nr:hypothetical protein EJB05_40659 [Eragrostis curvula]
MALSDRLAADAENFVPKGLDANDFCACDFFGDKISVCSIYNLSKDFHHPQDRKCPAVEIKRRLLVGLPEGYCRLKTTTFYNPKRWNGLKHVASDEIHIAITGDVLADDMRKV